MAKNIELLKRLRTRFLRMRHSRHFDMSVIAEKTDCGAAMCQIGHLLTLSGYRMRRRKYPNPDIGAVLDYDFIKPNGRVVQNPWQEAQILAGLSSQEASALFTDYSLKTPRDAAARIEKIIAEAEAA